MSGGGRGRSPFITVMGSSIWGLSRLIPITVARFSTFILFTDDFSCTSNKNLPTGESPSDAATAPPTSPPPPPSTHLQM